jgi:hypothetical protein
VYRTFLHVTLVFASLTSYLSQAQKLQQAMRALKQAPPAVFCVSDMVASATNLPAAVHAFKDLVGAFLPADQGHALMKAAGAVMELHSECSRKQKEIKAAAAAASSLGGKREPPPPPPAAPTSPARAPPPRGETDNGVELRPAGAFAATIATTAPNLVKDTAAVDAQLELAVLNDMLNKAVLADPAGTIFSAAENVLTEKRNFDDDSLNSANAPLPEAGERTGGGDRMLARNVSRKTAIVEAVSKVFDGECACESDKSFCKYLPHA